jgi:hypothetical protein
LIAAEAAESCSSFGRFDKIDYVNSLNSGLYDCPAAVRVAWNKQLMADGNTTRAEFAEF